MRSTIVGRKCMVASSHTLASLAGSHVLMHGGNVVDAAIATSAALCVVQNNLCGLGGDLFLLLKLGGSKIQGLNGSGRAGERATIDMYLTRGMSEIPKRGPLSVITVPGIVDAWNEIHKRFASMELKELLRPAIDYASSGVALTKKYSDSIKVSSRFLSQYKGWSELFTPGDEVPQAGSIFRQKELSKTLSGISEDGPRSFYEGELAGKIIKGIEKAGGVLSERDFREHKSTWDDPLQTNYRGIDIYETAPNSQGATVILWLNLLERFNVRDLSPDSLLELLVKTCLLSYEERSMHISDPIDHPLPKDFCTKRYAEQLISTGLVSVGNLESDSSIRGDTTYFAVGDNEGNCVSAIQSNYMGFGSGLVPEGTGFVLQNRGAYFTLNRSHHNSLAPGKRTFHTLCASMGELNGETLFALGSMGGDIQPQVHVQLMTKLLDQGLDLQAAIDSPRWIIPGTIYEKHSRIVFEERQSKQELFGLKLECLGERTSQTGHAQAIFYAREGGICGAADERGDGSAIGF